MEAYHEFDYINDKGIEFYWATAFCFTKDDVPKDFLLCLPMLWKIISIFPNVYDLGTRNFRNDLNRIFISCSWNGFLENDWIKKLPEVYIILLTG